MKFNSKSYFQSFLKRNLTKENAQEIYEIFTSLENGEEILFRNCCKILGIKKDEFLDGFRGLEEMQYAEDDTCTGFVQIAAGEKYGVIEYEFPDEPSYGAIKEVRFDKNNPELIEFNQKLFQSTIHDIVNNFKEADYSDSDILRIVEEIGAFNDKNRRCLYEHTAYSLVEVETEMEKYNLQGMLDENGKPTDVFIDNFNLYFNSLGEYKQKALLALAGVAKGIVSNVELAGHDCL